MGIRGDFDKLEALRRKIKDAARSGLKERVLKAAAAEARTQVALEFRLGVDPDGNPWAPLKHRSGQILRLTGRLANSFTSVATATGLRVGTNVAYAVFHQKGTGGHKQHTRFQAVGGKGRFVSRKSRANARGKSSKVRALNFKEGGGKIPARPMVPEGRLTARWSAAIDKAMDVAIKNFFQPK